MLFNSLPFAYFFLLLFPVYWLLPRKPQNWLLLGAGYYFYSCWDPRFLSLLILSTVMDYFCGIMVNRIEEPKKRKGFVCAEHGPESRHAGVLQVFQLLRREPAACT